MKKSTIILAIVFFISLSFPFSGLNAQDKTKDQKVTDQRIQDEIDAQKKAMVEQQKAQQEMKKAMDDARLEQQKARFDAQEAQKMAQEAMRNYRVRPGDTANVYRIYRDMGRNRSFSTGEPFIFAPNMELLGHTFGDTESTTWEFSKSVKENSFSRDYTFDVETTVNTVVMAVNGDCKAGEINIKIVMPNGKAYTDIVIDEFGNLNWRKSFNISETENQDKAGAWKFEINSKKATGYFRISLQTY